MTPPRRACAGCGELTSSGYLCDACRPPRRCLDCHEPIVGRSRNATTCLACAALRVTRRKGGQRRSECARCQQPIKGRGPRAIYCTPCAAFMNRLSCQTAQSLARRPWAAQNPVRDLELEARIEANVAALRRDKRYTVTDEVVWSRTTDLVAEQAQDLSDVGLISPQQRQWQAASRARRRQQKGQAA